MATRSRFNLKSKIQMAILELRSPRDAAILEGVELYRRLAITKAITSEEADHLRAAPIGELLKRMIAEQCKPGGTFSAERMQHAEAAGAVARVVAKSK